MRVSTGAGLRRRALAAVLCLGLGGCVTTQENRSTTPLQDAHAGIAANRIGDHARAVPLLTRGLESDALPEELRIQVLFRRALSLNNIGRADEAIVDADAAISHKADFAEAYNARGLAYLVKGQPDFAILDFDTAIKLQPEYMVARSNRAFAYQRKGQYDEAIADFSELIRVRKLAGDYADRGDTYLFKSDDTRALADFDEAIKLNPKLGVAYNGRGVVKARAGQYDDAIGEFSAALSNQPGLPVAYLNRGIFRLATQRYGAAVDDLSRYSRMAPGHAFAALYLYVARSRQGNNGTAELARQLAPLEQAVWPRQIAAMFQGTMTPQRLREIAADADANLRAIYTCHAVYYAAEYQRLKGQGGDAKAGFEEAVKLCPKFTTESVLAAAALMAPGA